MKQMTKEDMIKMNNTKTKIKNDFDWKPGKAVPYIDKNLIELEKEGLDAYINVRTLLSMKSYFDEMVKDTQAVVDKLEKDIESAKRKEASIKYAIEKFHNDIKKERGLL